MDEKVMIELEDRLGRHQSPKSRSALNRRIRVW